MFRTYAGNAGYFPEGAKIQLHADTDEICSACPNNEKGCCSSFSLVEAI
ncbi:MAG: DUF1284 domain-containing protein [Blautia sp.]